MWLTRGTGLSTTGDILQVVTQSVFFTKLTPGLKTLGAYALPGTFFFYRLLCHAVRLEDEYWLKDEDRMSANIYDPVSSNRLSMLYY